MLFMPKYVWCFENVQILNVLRTPTHAYGHAVFQVEGTRLEAHWHSQAVFAASPSTQQFLFAVAPNGLCSWSCEKPTSHNVCTNAHRWRRNDTYHVANTDQHTRPKTLRWHAQHNLLIAICCNVLPIAPCAAVGSHAQAKKHRLHIGCPASGHWLLKNIYTCV